MILKCRAQIPYDPTTVNDQTRFYYITVEIPCKTFEDGKREFYDTLETICPALEDSRLWKDRYYMKEFKDVSLGS
tara:strand:- start:164 stop:388 length:225 start_codon:yes stop_codon:yes gene_type:complete